MSYKGAFWRRMARLGATRFPRWFVVSAPILIGFVFFLGLGRTRRQVRRNLRLVYGERDFARELLDGILTFVRFAQCLTEGMIERQPRAVVERGRDRVEPLFSKGVVFLTAHLGPWYGNAAILGEENVKKLMLVMAKEDDAGAQAIQDQSGAASIVRLSGQPLEALPILHHLRDGGIVAMQIDRVPKGSESLRAEIFGREFLVPKGPFQLAALAGVPLVTVFAARAGFHAVRSDAGEPIFLPRRPTEAELLGAARAAARDLEAAIARFPTEWFHFVD